MKDKQITKINEIIKEERELLKSNGKFYNSIQVKFDKDFMYLNADGNVYQIKFKGYSDKLFKASIKERLSYNISPDGYGINWEKLNEDLSVKSIIRDRVKIEHKDSPFKKRIISSKSVKA